MTKTKEKTMQTFDELFEQEFSRGEQLPPKDDMTRAEKRWGHEQFAAERREAERFGETVKEYRERTGVKQ